MGLGNPNLLKLVGFDTTGGFILFIAMFWVTTDFLSGSKN